MTARWVVSRFARLSWRDGQVELVSPLSDITFETTDLELARVVHAFSRPRTRDDVVRELAPAVPELLVRWVDDLVLAGILVSADDAEAASSEHWDASALAYHRRSRRPEPRRIAVQTERERRALHDDALVLPRGVELQRRDLLDLLDERRSARAWSPASLPLATFAAWLWACARDRGGAVVSRSYPSGGAVYSLELYPVLGARAVDGTDAGVYHYRPDAHALEPIAPGADAAAAFLDAAARSMGAEAPPPIVIVVTSRIARQGEIYGPLAYSLVLKEVGCLMQTMYLVAAYQGLAACALGAGAPPGRLARLCGTSEVAEPVVGELALGAS